MRTLVTGGAGFIRLMEHPIETDPVNIGNLERTIAYLTRRIATSVNAGTR